MKWLPDKVLLGGTGEGTTMCCLVGDNGLDLLLGFIRELRSHAVTEKVWRFLGLVKIFGATKRDSQGKSRLF